MTDRLFAPPSMEEHIEMLREDIRALSRTRCTDEEAAEAANFLIDESHTQTTGLLVLSGHIVRETENFLDHLKGVNGLK